MNKRAEKRVEVKSDGVQSEGKEQRRRLCTACSDLILHFFHSLISKTHSDSLLCTVRALDSLTVARLIHSPNTEAECHCVLWDVNMLTY